MPNKTAPVDKLFDVPNCHVYSEKGKVYAKTLNQCNIGANANKFYIIQILQSKKDKNQFYTWNRWGRVGYDGQTAVKSFKDAGSAIKDFDKKLYDKTVKGDYVEIDIDYSGDDNDEEEEEEEEDEEEEKQSRKGAKGRKAAAGSKTKAKSQAKDLSKKKKAQEESEDEEEDEEEDDDDDNDDEYAKPEKKLKTGNTGNEVERVNAAWDGIEEWYKHNFKSFKFVGGASDEEIRKLEAKLKKKFDEGFKASLKRHNGVKKWPKTATLLTIKEIISTTHEMVSGKDDTAENAEEDDRRQDEWWCDDWIPFTGTSDYYLSMIDFKPTKKGKLGQILDWMDEEGATGPKYDCFTDYLEGMLKCLQDGKYEVVDDDIEEV